MNITYTKLSSCLSGRFHHPGVMSAWTRQYMAKGESTLARGDSFAEMVGSRIRELRRQAGMTQRDLAGEDLSTGFLSQVERGLTTPSLHSLHIIAENLGVSTSALMPDRPLGKDNCLPTVEILLSLAESQRLIGQVESALASVQLARQELEGEATNRDQLRAAASLQSGLAHLEQGASDLAFSDLTSAAERFEAAPDPEGILKCLLGMAEMHVQRENPLLAIQFLDTVIHRVEELEEGQENICRMLAEWGLGRAYRALKETETANELLGDALNRVKVQTDVARQVTYSVEMAQRKLAEKNYDDARYHASRAKTLSTLRFSQRAESEILRTSGLAWEDAGDRDRALSSLSDAAHIASDLGDSTLLAQILLARGTICLRKDDLSEASAITDEALAIIDATSKPILRGKAALLAGKIALSRDQHGRAETLLTEAETCFRETGTLSMLAQVQAELGRVYLATGERDKALHRFRRASDLFSRLSPGSSSPHPRPHPWL